MKLVLIFSVVVLCLPGCATIEKGAGKVGEAAGYTVNTAGTVTEKGAETLNKDNQPNPYGR